MSEARTHQESVEEAVFKYVGVDLEGEKQDTGVTSLEQHTSQQGQQHGQDQQSRRTQALTRMVNSGHGGPRDMEWFLRHELGSASAEPQAVAAAAVAAAFATSHGTKRRRSGADEGDDNNSNDGDNDDNNNNNNHNNINDNSNNDDDDDNDNGNSGGSSREMRVAAHASKRFRNSAEARAGTSSSSSSSRAARKMMSPLTGRAPSKVPHLAAVDPELASLDDPEDVTEHEQLVRKAILDADSIAHHPDFQHYLNTEDDSDDKSRGGSLLAHKGDAGRKIEVLPKVAGRSGSGSNGSNGSSSGGGGGGGGSNGSGAGGGLAQRGSHHGIGAVAGPNGSGAGTGSRAGAGSPALSGAHSEQDISHLIQDAATKASDFISAQSQSTGKSFDAAEEQALEHFVGDYQAIKNLSRRQICERIWSNERRKDDFWTNICKVLPYRTRSSIYKHVRRKYHIFEQRGKWTPGEDQELAQLCLEKEGQWSEIGKTLGRMPEDCRDRWRNYVKCGNNRASNKWSPQEEEQLKLVIAELLDTAELQSDPVAAAAVGASYDTDDGNGHLDPQTGKAVTKKKKQDAKDTINWTVVSERMGGTRSRIQCRYKWNKLLKKQAMTKIKTISQADKTWILEKLRDMGFTEDSQVDWDELATLMPGRQWSGTELKLCYEKLRTGVKYYKDRTINQICKELIGTRDDGLSLESDGKL